VNGVGYSWHPTATLLDEILADPIFSASIRFALHRLGDLDGKTVVEVGSGSGDMVVLFALLGAKRALGIDKRREAVVEGRSRAQRHGVADRCEFVEALAEALPLKDESVDVVFSKSTLQYLDRPLALGEYMRVLRSDGQLVLIENRRLNPFINLYRLWRWVASHARGDTTYIRSILGYVTEKEIADLRARFESSTQRHDHLARMVPMALLGRFGRNAWTERFDREIAAFDRRVLSSFGPARHLAWITAVHCRTKKEKRAAGSG
jgi:ubiquinone/menaquinone biosynthesis C-methylase UbiE